jgi:hypothetical protein
MLAKYLLNKSSQRRRLERLEGSGHDTNEEDGIRDKDASDEDSGEDSDDKLQPPPKKRQKAVASDSSSESSSEENTQPVPKPATKVYIIHSLEMLLLNGIRYAGDNKNGSQNEWER